MISEKFQSIHIGKWGIEQAELYTYKLEILFQKLVDEPHMGVACDEILHGSRRFLMNMHHVYYRVDGKQIIIIRILHQSRKAKR